MSSLKTLVRFATGDRFIEWLHKKMCKQYNTVYTCRIISFRHIEISVTYPNFLQWKPW